ncbi:right-handed parallel beta-helix repeat-containing protein [bacterium]|nr:right-handed parallel beta-helix repeat-containing protein [bacterium]
MMTFLIFVLLFFAGCGGSNGAETDDSWLFESSDNSVSDFSQDNCSAEEPSYERAAPPEIVLPQDFPAEYAGDMNCQPLPEPTDSAIFLGEGCYYGCLKVEGELKIAGEGSGKTLLFCNDAESSSAIEVKQNSIVILESLSISSLSRGLTLDHGASARIVGSAVYGCMKGGINACQSGEGCRSDLTVLDSYIGEMSDESDIGYGISFGCGGLKVEKSRISHLASFGIGIWGEDSCRADAEIKDSVVSDIYGMLRDDDGICFFAEGGARISIKNTVFENCGRSFALFFSDNAEQEVTLTDLSASGIGEGEAEQGGIVFEGAVSAELERVSITDSKGYGIFSLGAEFTAEDLSISVVASDGFGDNGFGLLLADGAETEIRRLEVRSAERAGILADGLTRTEICDFEVSGTASDRRYLEFGIGIALQNGAEVTLDRGLVDKNRESGILVSGSRLELRDALIQRTMPRECSGSPSGCLFAPEADFGHGISLYSGSELFFDGVVIAASNNGLNLEASSLTGSPENIVFNNNVTAVNAWNVDNYDELSEKLKGSVFCGNSSVFTSDFQPVRGEIDDIFF